MGGRRGDDAEPNRGGRGWEVASGDPGASGQDSGTAGRQDGRTADSGTADQRTADSGTADGGQRDSGPADGGRRAGGGAVRPSRAEPNRGEAAGRAGRVAGVRELVVGWCAFTLIDLLR